MYKLIYPANFAAASALGASERTRAAIEAIQKSAVDEERYKPVKGEPVITILDFSILLRHETGIQEIDSIGAILRSISRFVRVNFNASTKDSTDALGWLATLDRRLGVWCACQVAKEGLRYIPEYPNKASFAIETTEAWVRGEADEETVNNAADTIINYTYLPVYSAAYDTAVATNVFNTNSNFTTAAVAYSVGTAAARAKDYENLDFYARERRFIENRDIELRRLTNVAANAVLTFPV